VSQQLHSQTLLPGELQAYQDVTLYPKVQGFVEWIEVDRGSVVKEGQLLIRLIAPELTAHRREATAKVQAAQAQRLEAEAKLAADEATYKRLKAASATPGVITGNDVDVAQKLSRLITRACTQGRKMRTLLRKLRIHFKTSKLISTSPRRLTGLLPSAMCTRGVS